MSRKTSTDTAADEAMDDAPPAPDPDLHGFWDRARLTGEDNDEAFSIVIDEDDPDRVSEVETLTYMGNVTQIDNEELAELATWAETKACRYCRDKMAEHHDPNRLLHDECRRALRVTRLLRRYN